MRMCFLLLCSAHLQTLKNYKVKSFDHLVSEELDERRLWEESEHSLRLIRQIKNKETSEKLVVILIIIAVVLDLRNKMILKRFPLLCFYLTGFSLIVGHVDRISIISPGKASAFSVCRM